MIVMTETVAAPVIVTKRTADPAKTAVNVVVMIAVNGLNAVVMIVETVIELIAVNVVETEAETNKVLLFL